MAQNPRDVVAGWLLVVSALAAQLAGGPAWAESSASSAQLGASPAPLVERSLLLGFLADNSTATLIDARSAEEFAAQHVAGAINIPFDQLDAHVDELPTDANEPIIIYCRSGLRAGLLQKTLVERGFGNVHVLPPRQLFWTDEVMVFNCGVTEAAAPAAITATTTGADATGAVATDGPASR